MLGTQGRYFHTEQTEDHVTFNFSMFYAPKKTKTGPCLCKGVGELLLSFHVHGPDMFTLTIVELLWPYMGNIYPDNCLCVTLHGEYPEEVTTVVTAL